MAHGAHFPVRADDGVGGEPLAQAPECLLALLSGQASPCGVVEEDDLGAVVVVHRAPTCEQVIEHFGAGLLRRPNKLSAKAR